MTLPGGHVRAITWREHITAWWRWHNEPGERIQRARAAWRWHLHRFH
ncbi:hypothetical protein [Streptomyces sp. CS014]|nr:hypothetical protein [Streptomyces sp. CS014]